MMNLNIENLKKWAVALRSGEYKQARQQLEREDGSLCCLGVAHHCLLGVNPETAIQADQDYNAYIAIRNALASNANGGMNRVEYMAMEGQFIRANDVQGKTFTEIADMVDVVINRALAAQEQVYAAN